MSALTVRVNDAPTLPYHTKKMMHPHLTVIFQIIICLLLTMTIIHLMKGRVPRVMTGAMKMMSSVVTCVELLVKHTKEVSHELKEYSSYRSV